VRMRRRKPWVLARRRLLGWNVRLLTRGLPDLMSEVVHDAWRRPVRAQPVRPESRAGRSNVARTRPATVRSPAPLVKPANRTDRLEPAVEPASRTSADRCDAGPTANSASSHVTTAATPGHADPCRTRARKMSRGLWTTACCPPSAVVSVSPRRRALPHRSDRRPPCEQGRTGTCRGPMYTACGRPCGRKVTSAPCALAGGSPADATREG
jgi:hypothetical protein